MNTTNIYNTEEDIQRMVKGINAVADIVGSTIGAKGKNVIIQEDVFPFHSITNDGISIANACYSEDPLEQRGMDLIKEANALTDKKSKDGRTTTTILTQAIINEGIAQDVSGIEVMDSLNALIPIIEESIDKQKKLITVDEIASVATTASQSVEMGALLQEIYQQIGKEGIIELGNSNTDKTFYTIKDGVRFTGASLVSSALHNSDQQAIHLNPKVLVTRLRLSTNSDIEGILSMMQENKETKLVIFCDDMENSVASSLIAAHVSGQFSIAIIKAPTLWKYEIMEDFAKVTGATVIGEANGLNWKNVEWKHLGTCGKIVSDKYETIVTGIADITEHIENLKSNGDDVSLLRLSWLNTKCAILKIGAGSESELSYLRRKTADAISASRLALEDGVVAGGGVALLNISYGLPDNVGGKILFNALRKPIKKIYENSGNPLGDKDISMCCGDVIGFNAKTGILVNMWEAQILDPALVVKNAIRNAISVAGTVLTAGGIIIKKPKSDEEKTEELMKSLRPF